MSVQNRTVHTAFFNIYNRIKKIQVFICSIIAIHVDARISSMQPICDHVHLSNIIMSNSRSHTHTHTQL